MLPSAHRPQPPLYIRGALGSSGFLLLLLTWFLATSVFQLIAPIRFPSPVEVCRAFVRLLETGYADATLVVHFLQSLQRVVLGYAIAAVIAIPLGLAMGLSRVIDGTINPVFQLLRPIPALAWIPLTILWFGLGLSAQVFVVSLAAFAPTVINTYTGVKSVNPILIAAARVHGASASELLTHVVIPSALPMIFTGLRISLQVCWMALIAAELVGSTSGLGHIMITAERDLDPAMIAAGMISVALLGMLTTALLSAIERAAMPWLR
jgi:taurine transport system permease protein